MFNGQVKTVCMFYFQRLKKAQIIREKFDKSEKSFI